MRKGLEKLNGKTAEYQKWLKDRFASVVFGQSGLWLYVAQLASLMVGAERFSGRKCWFDLMKRERRKGS